MDCVVVTEKNLNKVLECVPYLDMCFFFYIEKEEDSKKYFGICSNLEETIKDIKKCVGEKNIIKDLNGTVKNVELEELKFEYLGEKLKSPYLLSKLKEKKNGNK